MMACSESIVDEPTPDSWNPLQIDSIVVRDVSLLELTVKDTIRLELAIFPTSAELDENKLFLLKKNTDGTQASPSAYNISGLKKLTTKNDNSYLLYIADTDAGYGYIDSVQICYHNTGNVIRSRPFEIKNAGTSLFSFSLSDGVYTWDSFDIKNDTIWIQVPNSFNLKAASSSFSHNGEGVYLNDVKLQSGKECQNYSDFCNPLEFVVKGFDGNESHYVVEVFNLPIIFINTPDGVDITSRYEWLDNCSFVIVDTDGTMEDYGVANVKGRGNSSWREGIISGKKPYTIKLENKPKERTVLGMPGHKRWVLLANPFSFLPNPVGFEVNRRVESCNWAPQSRFVELMLNGKHQGLYLLCEQIRVDKNRIGIKEMKKSDLDGDAVTGGYLISFDDADEDDDPVYYSQYYNMPFLIKNPDTEDIQQKQLEYITNYINEFESSIYNDERFQSGDFYNYIDVDSWIDYYFVSELWGSLELYRPRSVWMYKDRGGKLTAGPLWDFEANFFDKQQLYCNNAFYFGRLFQSKEVLDRMKDKWALFRSNLIGNAEYDSIIDYIDSLYNECHFSADRDRKMTPGNFYWFLPPYTDSKIDIEYRAIRDNILLKLDWLEQQIMTW